MEAMRAADVGQTFRKRSDRIGRILWLTLIFDLVVFLFAAVQPAITVGLRPDGMFPETGNAYAISIKPRFPWPVVGIADDLSNPNRSRLRLFENGMALSPAHALHDTIRHEGHGAFSFWNGTLLFSTPDNSDPRVNGRAYRAVVPLGVGITGWLALAFINVLVSFIYRAQLPALISVLMRFSTAIILAPCFIAWKLLAREPIPWDRLGDLFVAPPSTSFKDVRLRALLGLRTTARVWARTTPAWKYELTLVALVAGLPLLVPYLIGLGGFLFADPAYATLPMKALGIRALASGELPLWTSALGSGLPMIGDGISLPYDPRNLWWAAFDPLTAYVAMLLTSRCALMIVCYLYFRVRLGFSRGPAFAASCVYFCGTLFVMELSYSHLSSCLESVPMMAWLAERLLDRPNVARALHLALGWFLVLLISSVAYFIFMPVLIGAWVFAISIASGWAGQLRRMVAFACWYAAAQVWGLLLFAFAFLPMLEMIHLSNRGGEYLNDPFALRSLWGLFAGPLTSVGSAVSPPFAHFFYVGVVSIPLIAVAVRLRDARVKAATWLAVPTLGGILLSMTPVKGVFAAYFPALDSMAFFRLSFFWGFLAAVLVGHGLQQRYWRPSEMVRYLTFALLAVQLAFVAFVVVFSAIVTVDIIELPEWRSRLAESAEFWLPSSVVSCLVVYALLRGLGLALCLRRGGSLRRTLVGGVLVFELVLFFSFYRLIPGVPFRPTPEVEYLTRHASPDNRVALILDFSNTRADLSAPDDWSIWDLHMNGQGWWKGLLSANAYNSLIPADYASFFRLIGDRPMPWRGASATMATEKSDSPLLPLLGLRWLISRHKLDPGPYHEVLRGSAYHVYEMDSPMSRAYGVAQAVEAPKPVVHEILARAADRQIPASLIEDVAYLEAADAPAPGSPAAAADKIIARLEAEPAAPAYVPAHVVADTGTRVEVEITMKTAGWLILTDNDYAGWTATLNGQAAAIRRANLFARAVAVPPGHSVVAFEYRPASFRNGALISVIALAISALVLLATAWRARRAKVSGVTLAAGRA